MTEQIMREAMDHFIAGLNTEHTQQSYATPLKHFGEFLHQQGLHTDQASVTELTVDHAIDFVPWLRQECFADPDQPSKATLQLYLTAVYRFYRSLLKRGIAFSAADIARLEETYRDARNIRGEPRPKDPRLAAVEAIIQAARSLPPVCTDKPADRQCELSRLRDIAVVETLRSTGCRVGELVALHRGDLDWVAHSALVKGKGSKYRKVYLDDRAWQALVAYLHARQDGGQGRELARLPVFCGHGNRSGRVPAPLTTRHVARIIQDLAQKAGIAEVGVTPHYFRHVFATRALDRTENLALVQDMLGHASPATTRIYAKTNEKQRQEGYRRVWDEMEHSVATLDEGFARVWDQAETSQSGPPVDSYQVALSILNVARTAPDSPAAGEQFSRLLSAALVEVLWSTGCSLDEVTALRLGDVGQGVHSLHINSHSEEETFHLLTDQTWNALNAYLRVRTPALSEREQSDALFCNADGSPLTVNQTFVTIKELAGQAGVGEEHIPFDLFHEVFVQQAQ